MLIVTDEISFTKEVSFSGTCIISEEQLIQTDVWWLRYQKMSYKIFYLNKLSLCRTFSGTYKLGKTEF